MESSELDHIPVTKDDNTTWKIDKRIPIALIVLLIFQTLGFVWGAAQLSSDVSNLQVNFARVEAEVKQLNGKFERYQTTFTTREDSNRVHDQFDEDIAALEGRMRDLERDVYRKTK